jgi:microcystin-dependent protein
MKQMNGGPQWYPALLNTKGADVASAATINLDNATGDVVDVTGDTPITAITLAPGVVKTIRFTGVSLLTHGANLILPGAANITTAAGDFAVVRGYASGVVRCQYYTVAAARPSAFLPAGAILDFGGTAAPTGFLACDGAAVSRTTFDALFAAIGITWGAGDGSTTFNVPNFQRRVAVGSGGSGTATLANTVGSVGGAETHTLTIAEMPAHAHSNGRPANLDSRQDLGGTLPDGGDQNTGSTGGGGAHNNMQPSAVVLKIIKT